MRDKTESTSPRTPQCSEALAALPLYVGQDLDSAEMDSVARHLNGCQPCSDEHERARSARAVFSTGTWIPEDFEGPSLWEGVRAEMVAEGLIGGRPRLVSGPVGAGPVGAGPVSAGRVAGSRWWLGSGAAAAALFCAFGLSGLLGSVDSDGGGFDGSHVDVDGTLPTVSLKSQSVESDPPASEPVAPEDLAPGHLRRPGADRSPLLHNAIEWLPEQGIYIPVTAPPKPALVDGPRRLKPVQKD